jgi:predicted NUDIX family phosphoesterase
MIESAIKASQKKDVATQVIQSEDDNGNVTVSVINSDTGEIIKQTSLGAVGTKTKTASGSTKESETLQNKQTMINDIKNGATLRDLVSYYGAIGGLDTTDIYNLYNKYSTWGKATESLEDIKAGTFYD